MHSLAQDAVQRRRRHAASLGQLAAGTTSRGISVVHRSERAGSTAGFATGGSHEVDVDQIGIGRRCRGAKLRPGAEI